MNNEAPTAALSGITNRGQKVHSVHPMAHAGYFYKFTTVSGNVHVDEYVKPMGAWVYLGALK